MHILIQKKAPVLFLLFILTTGLGAVLISYNVMAQSRGMIALNYNDVEIADFLKMMSSLTGKNIIVSEKVRGKITVISSKRVPVSEAYNLMVSILQVKGFAVIESDNMVKVVPLNEAILNNTEVIIDNDEKVSVTDDRTITYILSLEYADAAEISRILNTMKSAYTRIIFYNALNVVIFSGVSSEIDGLIKIARALDVKPSEDEITADNSISQGNIHVVHLQNAKAEDLAGVLSRVPFSETAKVDTSPQVRDSRQASQTTNRQPQTPQQQSKLSIIANKETNSLIITATAEEFSYIKRVIDELDIVRQQVLIEALIIEVSAENGWGFGINWMLGDQRDSNIYGGSQILGSTASLTSTSKVMGKTSALPLASGFQLGYMNDSVNLGFVLLNASANDKNFNVLSTPQILTTDNQEAEINVGEEFAIPSNNRVSTDGTLTYSYEYKSAGLKLKITPHITKGDMITLDLYQEVNDIKDASVAATSTSPPNVTKRDIKTRISVTDGKTIVVGGLISNKKVEEVNKVPLLGDIPLVGWLFKNKSVKYTKTNLLVFITPHVVTDPLKLDSITKQKTEEQKILQK